MADYGLEHPEIAAAIDALTIIDTHEHLPPHERGRQKDTDVLCEYLTHYFNRDLISAGLTEEDRSAVADRQRSLKERWAIVAPYWEACRLTGYGRALDLTARGLYGLDRIDGGTIEALDERFQATLRQEGQYRIVLKERSRIETSVLDAGTLDADRAYFRPAANIGMLVMPSGTGFKGELAGIRIRCFQDWLDGCDAWVERALRDGAACFKSAMAYQRSVDFPRTTFGAAEEDFNAALRVLRAPDWEAREVPVGVDFQNYVMHHVLRAIGRSGKTLQVHTGIQEGNGNILSDSHPLLLTRLLLEYPDVDFDIFHMSYPYQGELAALCKNFSNAYIDMCWGHIVSPRAAMLALDEWLDAVPYNKISAFGGDYCMIDTVYGHQEMARRGVSKVLSRKAAAGEITVGQAAAIAGALFYDNPKRILKL